MSDEATVLRDALRALAERLEQLPPDPMFAALDAGGGRVTLRAAPLPSDPSAGAYVQLRLWTEVDDTVTSQWLKRGSREELLAYLRDPATHAAILQTVHELSLAQQRRLSQRR